MCQLKNSWVYEMVKKNTHIYIYIYNYHCYTEEVASEENQISHEKYGIYALGRQ